MPVDQSACKPARLRILLNAPEDSADYQNLSAHVESCESCQQELSKLAADESDWKFVGESLTEDDLDQEYSSEVPSDCSQAMENTPSRLDVLAEQVLEPPTHPEMLGRLGRYEVERWIGSGGMGIVFKAFDTELNRPVAIKVLAPHLAGSGAAKKRFAREGRAVAAVAHEHVVAIHNVESDHDPPFLVMQYLAGESLQSRLNRVGPLELCEILRIGLQTAAGLGAAHAQGLVHRDVKPSNILLENEVDRAVLTDFGLARASDDASLTHSGCLAGTPHYMSPEQARGDSVGCEGDLFSLGAVLYTMCAGHPPFRAETAYGTLRRITDAEPRSLIEQNPNIPPWLERIVFKLLAKDPRDRFVTANELADILEDCLAHAQNPADHALPQSLEAPKARQWFAPAMVLGLILLIVSVSWLATRPWFPTEANETAARPTENNTEPASPGESAGDADPVSGWNHAQQELDALENEADDLETELTRPW